ncbi:MAG: endolytic transglycosylase MltG [Hydrogenobaculum sp.]
MQKTYKQISFIIFGTVLIFGFWLLRPHIVNKTIDIYGLNKEEAIDKISRDGIANKYILEALLDITHAHIKYGEYRFKGLVSPFEVYRKLTRGEFLLHKITIPEGFDIYDIANRLQENGICSKKAFLKYAKDKSYANKLGLKSDGFEGYLFPDTYFFYKHENPKDIIYMMYQDFKEKMKENHLKPTKDQIIIASIVEKEAKYLKDKPLVASVIYNRLKKDMPLQMDSTVVYALKIEKKWNGTLTKKDLSIKSPYNTYLVKGLPPTPICNPGINSIKSAIYPAKSNYLYFVSDKAGNIYFNKSLKNHIKTVKKVEG